MSQSSAEPLRFAGRVAIVTGAGGQKPGLGETFARVLDETDAELVEVVDPAMFDLIPRRAFTPK